MDILNAITPIVKDFLGQEITAYNAQKKERIENYVFSRNPRYRPLLKHYSECIERIPFMADDEKLELELFKQEQGFRLKMKKEQKDILGSDVDSIQSNEEYQKKCADYLQRLSDMGKGDLADYIMHRKVMLDILSHILQYTDEEKKKYALERQIHNLIFPMIATSDDIDFDKHNLWIIDEKLAYRWG